MLAAHVQQEINSQTTTDGQKPKIKLTCCQLGLQGPELLVTPLGLDRLDTSQLEVIADSKHINAPLNVGVIKTKDVVAA